MKRQDNKGNIQSRVRRMGLRSLSGVSAMFLMPLLALPLAADTIVMDNGQRQEGLYEEDPVDKTMIYFTTTGGRIRIPSARIKEVIRDTPAESNLKLGNAFFQIAEYEQAAKHFYEATRLEPNNSIAAARLEAAQAKLSEKQEVANSEKRDTARGLLEEARQLIAEERYEPALGKIRSAEARAGELIELEARAALANLYEAWGHSRLDRLDDLGAIEQFETALKYGQISTEAQEKLLLAYERVPERRGQVIQFYQDKLAANPGNLETRLKLADLLHKEGRFNDETDILLDIMKAQPNALAREQKERLLSGLKRKLNEVTDQRDFEAARDTYLLLLEYFPQYTDENTLYFYEYYVRAQSIDQNSYEDRLELGKYAHAHGLVREAKAEYQKAVEINPEGEEAQKAILDMAGGQLEEARQLAQSNDIESSYFALAQAQSLKQEYPNSPQIQEGAQEVAEIAENRIREHMRKLERSAIDIANKGDEYYQQALSFIAMAQNRDLDDNVRILNPTNEAAANLQRAINAWTTALQLDPSLAELAKGDLTTKISDARRLYNQIRAPLRPLDTRSVRGTRDRENVTPDTFVD